VVLAENMDADNAVGDLESDRHLFDHRLVALKSEARNQGSSIGSSSGGPSRLLLT
jgi:hypothetical protein